MKIEFLLLPEYGEQSERKNEQIIVPLFFPLLALWPCTGSRDTAITSTVALILLFCILEPAGGI